MLSSSIKTIGVRHNPISIPVFFPLLCQVLVWQPSLVNESFTTSIGSHVCHEDVKSSLLKKRPIKAKIYNRHSLWLERHCGLALRCGCGANQSAMQARRSSVADRKRDLAGGGKDLKQRMKTRTTSNSDPKLLLLACY
jgi:hypothetical protein